MTIDWKPDHDLIAKHPRKLSGDDEEGFEGDIGSFFHLFTEKADVLGLGRTLMDVLTEPLEFFANDPAGFESDFEDEDEDEGSIDLGDEDDEDEPDRKKQKKE